MISTHPIQTLVLIEQQKDEILPKTLLARVFILSAQKYVKKFNNKPLKATKRRSFPVQAFDHRFDLTVCDSPARNLP